MKHCSVLIYFGLNILLLRGDLYAAGVDFSPSVAVNIGAGPFSITIGDFNGDGKRDIATANESTNEVSVLLGNGDGTFGPSSNFAVGAGPESVVTGDFNRDGKSDLVASSFCCGW
jgi:hypothetical protein